MGSETSLNGSADKENLCSLSTNMIIIVYLFLNIFYKKYFSFNNVEKFKLSSIDTCYKKGCFRQNLNKRYF